MMTHSDISLSVQNKETRIIAMGSAELMEAFALLGFETWSNAKSSDVEKLMLDLLEHEQKAFVMLESFLAHFQTPVMKQLREKGGNIIITEIPLFQSPDNYHPLIDDLIVQALGPNALEINDED